MVFGNEYGLLTINSNTL